MSQQWDVWRCHGNGVACGAMAVGDVTAMGRLAMSRQCGGLLCHGNGAACDVMATSVGWKAWNLDQVPVDKLESGTGSSQGKLECLEPGSSSNGYAGTWPRFRPRWAGKPGTWPRLAGPGSSQGELESLEPGSGRPLNGPQNETERVQFDTWAPLELAPV